MHAFRRANITWRQEVGASAIEASKIAGHTSVKMTNDYTHVQLKRQEELTRAIQDRPGEATQTAEDVLASAEKRTAVEQQIERVLEALAS